MVHVPENTLIICGGLQGSGTTLVSYCYLQRADTDGVLDAEYDLLPSIDGRLAKPYAWYKTTISCFRLSEIAAHYRDAGWNVRTLLVVRDLRAVWASLQKKPYGRNGITAEDPPLRMRLRRFIDDWRSTQASQAAVLRYEDFVASPTVTLQRACADLHLPWDVAMLTWPKPPERISHCTNGNGSFWNSRGANLMSSLKQFRAQREPPRLPAADLHWLETEFHDFNDANGYPVSLNMSVDESTSLVSGLANAPNFEVTRRYEWETKRKTWRWFLSKLGRRNKKLIDQRTWKRAA